jgi:hypothetical protein
LYESFGRDEVTALDFDPRRDGSDRAMQNATRFYPGSIHSEEVRDFWQDRLKANELVMDVLKNGYVIPFIEPPPIYEEENNASAVQEIDFVHQAIAELKQLGVIEYVDRKPHCVSPLTVSKKIGSDGLLKKRLYLDSSRCVNLCIMEQKVTLSHLQRALEITRPYDFQVKYDLKAAYHHIRIHPTQIKYLGSAITRPDGRKQYFVFKHLPFGLSSAVHCITKLFKPVNAFIHENGIRHSIYLDDGRIVAETKRKAEENRILVYDVSKKSGWTLELKKSDGEGEASLSKSYLGFLIDTNSMTVRLEEAKKARILKQIWEIITAASRTILAKELAAILGKVVATKPALGQVVIMVARAGYADLEEATQKGGWSSSLVMSQASLDGLKFLAENFSTFDNLPIRSNATEISVLSIIGPPDDFMKTSFVRNHVRTEEERSGLVMHRVLPHALTL